ncbi:carbamoyltransferase [Pelagibacteraceae bacterium]|jgi:carbamoyltransferase|nr:carbamoyltransferase [Pelagibacteraceae bacterium]
MSIVLGLNAYHADSAAALIKDNELLFAVEEEKLNRKKHWAGFPEKSIEEAIKFSGIKKNEILNIAINTNPYSNISRKIPFFLMNFLLGEKKNEIFTRFKKKTSLKKLLIQKYNFNKKIKIHYIDHHLSHIASAYYASDFKKCLAISIDGFGDFASINLAKCNNKKITVFKKIYFPDSLGIFYEAMTQMLGFKNYGDEYKIMGMASYGFPEFYDIIKKSLFIENDFFKLNLVYFNHTQKNYSYKYDGVPQQQNIFNNKIFDIFDESTIENKKENIAASVQKVFEHFLIKIIKYGLSKYPTENLCLSGGCSLNSSANGKIIQATSVKKIFIPYAPGDAGGAIGSAMIVNNKKSNKILTNIKTPYLGPEFTNKQIQEALKNLDLNKFNYQEFNLDELCKEIALKISNSHVVGWFQDRIEFGARALGNRSILADPRNKNMREIINTKIKRRESFRPFAPTILEEEKENWFSNEYYNHYMEVVIKIKNKKKNLVPAVTHIDESCRLQVITELDNIKFYTLIKSFYKLTNVPILLNTSFNENEPIVCTPEEAIDCFLRTKMDNLVINNYIISRN